MILVVGKYHSSIIDYFESQKMNYFVLKDKQYYTEEDGHSKLVDFRDQAAVQRACEELPEKPSCIFAMYEQYIPTAAELNVKFNLAGLTPEVARICTDKNLMRAKLSEASRKISPAFRPVDNEQDLLDFAKEYGYPVFLKPANLSKSLLISRCDNEIELLAAYRKAVKFAEELYSRQTLNLRPRFIVEQFLEGTMHTVMTFSDKSGGVMVFPHIVDVVTAKQMGHDDTFLYARITPSPLPQATQKELLDCAKLAVETLELRSCPGHVELMLTEEGPMIIEVGARLGGYRSRMYQYVSGRNIVGMAMDSYRGVLPEPASTEVSEHSISVELFPETDGVMREITNLDELKALKSLTYLGLKSKPGDKIGKASHGYKAVAVIILRHADRQRVEADYQFITDRVKVLAD